MIRLPHACTRLLRRSRVLTLGQKAVWQEIVELGEMGCWLTAHALGQRINLSGPKVDEYRRTLRTAGLLRNGVRRNEGKRGNPGSTWVAVFPPHLIPASRTPSEQDLAALAEQLDAYLCALLDVELPPREGGQFSGIRPPKRVDNSRPVAGGVPTREGGGGGGEPPHSPCVLKGPTPPSGEEGGEQRSQTIQAGAARASAEPVRSAERTREEVAQMSERERGGSTPWDSWAERCRRVTRG